MNNDNLTEQQRRAIRQFVQRAEALKRRLASTQNAAAHADAMRLFDEAAEDMELAGLV